MIESSRPGTASVVTFSFRAPTNSIAILLTSLAPLACGEPAKNGGDSPVTTGVDTDTSTATTSESTGETAPTTSEPTTSTTGGASSDPTTEDSSSSSSSSTSDGTTGDPPPSTCEAYCGMMQTCCGEQGLCVVDDQCLQSCEDRFLEAQHASDVCVGLYTDAYECASADCEAFVAFHQTTEGECNDKIRDSDRDPACDVPLAPESPLCVEACATYAACMVGSEEECLVDCNYEIYFGELDYGPACKQVLEEFYTCYADLSCEQVLDDESCPVDGQACGGR